MSTIIYVILAVLFVFILFKVVNTRKKRTKEEVDSYICSECGSRDCVCHKEHEKPEQHVKVYSLTTCSHCKSVKKLLSECMVKYEFTDVDMLKGEEKKAILEDVKKYNPRCSFPTIIIGDNVIVGYRENEIKAALGL